MSDELKEDIDKEYKWSWVKFIIGLTRLITSPETIAFGISTWFVYRVLFDNKTALGQEKTLLIIWGAITGLFILGVSFKKAISNAIYNMKITAELKAGAQANINTDTAKVIEAVKGGNNE
jgi:hypothetical protein